MENKPKIVSLYEEAEWRSETMSLLEFCRKSNKDGEIAQWVRRLFDQEESTDTADSDEEAKQQQLEAFANQCPMRGQKLVACDMLSIYNDRWFGQWLALRKPFRALEDLLDTSIIEKARPAFSQ